MANSKHVVYKSDGPHMEGAVRVGAGQGPGGSSAGRPAPPAGKGTSPVPVGAGGNAPQPSQLGNAVVGSMPAVNQINVSVNPDGTIGTSVEVADATPVTGPGASFRGSSPNANAGEAGVQTGWVKMQNGYKYYFIDESGRARGKTGWHYEINADGTKAWYYLDEDPLNKEWMVTGWKKITGPKGTYWYYFRPDGKMSTYWEWLDGLWYYLEPQDDNGNMTMGWREINGEWYYFIPDEDAGYMMIGWLEINGKWYYFYNSDDKRGIMAANHMVDHTDGKQYYLGSDGAMVVSVTFKSAENGRTYIADENGVCTVVGNSTAEDLEDILINSGYEASKAHSMAVAYEAFINEGYERNFAVGMMANILYEGSAGKLEGVNSAGYKYWRLAPQCIKDLAGKTITNENMARIWLNETPRVSGFGVGSIQWSFPDRRDGILKAYLSHAETWSREELGEIEVQYMISELKVGYENVVKKCVGMSAEFCAEHICRIYEAPSNMESNVRKRKIKAAELNNLLSNYSF